MTSENLLVYPLNFLTVGSTSVATVFSNCLSLRSIKDVQGKAILSERSVVVAQGSALVPIGPNIYLEVYILNVFGLFQTFGAVRLGKKDSSKPVEQVHIL